MDSDSNTKRPPRRYWHAAALLLGLAVLLAILHAATRPPRTWSQITYGTSRQDVLLALGPPDFDDEMTKGCLVWQRRLWIGRWELLVFFRHNAVAILGTRWRWAW
jgi:hypothetical protein